MSQISFSRPYASIPTVDIDPEILFDPSAGYVQVTAGSSTLAFTFTSASALNGWTWVLTAQTTFDYSGGGLPTGALASMEIRDPFRVLVAVVTDLAGLAISVADMMADPARVLSQNDTVAGSDGDDVLYGLAGDDVLTGGLGDDRAFGGAGQDRFTGGQGADTFHGEAGADTGYGNEGDDSLYGEAGDDALFGGGGNDTINGGDGYDVATGGLGADVLIGGADNDDLRGSEGSDTINGGDGEDFLFGNADADLIEGGEAFDRIFGGAGDDQLFGQNGDDRIEAGAGDDFVDGGQGHDDLFGGAGDDRIEGLGGADRLTGGNTFGDSVGLADPSDGSSAGVVAGSGNDTFVFFGRTPGVGDSVVGAGFNNGSADVITDFGGLTNAVAEDRDQLDFIEAGAAANYFERGTVVQGGFNAARALANDVFTQEAGARYVAVQFSASADTANGVGGVVIFLDTDGNNQVDQQVTLLGVTLDDLANDGSFIV
jgi:Ca2+-binding RTX toxin-like protein